MQVFANGKRKLNAVVIEVGAFRCIQCKTFKNSCCLLFLHLIQFNIFIFEYHIYSIKHCNQCLLGGFIKRKHISQRLTAKKMLTVNKKCHLLPYFGGKDGFVFCTGFL